jgi:hypothetical protein
MLVFIVEAIELISRSINCLYFSFVFGKTNEKLDFGCVVGEYSLKNCECYHYKNDKNPVTSGWHHKMNCG